VHDRYCGLVQRNFSEISWLDMCSKFLRNVSNALGLKAIIMYADLLPIVKSYSNFVSIVTDIMSLGNMSHLSDIE